MAKKQKEQANPEADAAAVREAAAKDGEQPHEADAEPARPVLDENAVTMEAPPGHAAVGLPDGTQYRVEDGLVDVAPEHEGAMAALGFKRAE